MYSIRVKDVTKVYQLYDKPVDRLKEAMSITKKCYHTDFFALDTVSFDVEKGQTVGIIGTNGSGKSTLIKLLLKELEPTEGTITINGQKLNKIRRRQIPKFRRKIGVVFQDFRLLKDRNIYDNVA